ncbi:MAG TPA: zinc ABC transporter substrate-binding protein [Xanthobacteraceae bacterium]
MIARALILLAALVATVPAAAQERGHTIKAIASFSIVGDLVRNVGGARVEVATLVGPNGNAHVYEPSPADSQSVADASVVFVNGLGFEGWLDRLVKASGTRAPIVVASAGIAPRHLADDPGHDGTDPHAWQSVANAKIYVANIRDALERADPAGEGVYAANAAAYLAKLDALDREVRAVVAAIAPERRRVVTSHNAFGYFQDAYGVTFMAPQGMSSEAEASAKDVARIITQIRADKISAVFLENVTDPRLVNLIATETGARIGGTLYSDALTDANGPAPTYVDLIRHNVRQLAAALRN